MSNIFQLDHFVFPYKYKFPGQATDEEILFVTRENKLMLYLRRLMIFFTTLAVLTSGWLLAAALGNLISPTVAAAIRTIAFTISLVFLVLGWWWITALWQKSIVMVTNKRLTKFVYTTPVSRYSLTLPLEMVVDMGAYTKGFLQTFLNLGTFMARSSATSSGVATDDPDRINKKYFYISNVAKAEDLQQYVNKLLSEFRARQNRLVGFRPFLPNLKGEARKEFLAKNYPEYL